MPAAIHVSHHAQLRYAERALGIDTTPFRSPGMTDAAVLDAVCTAGLVEREAIIERLATPAVQTAADFARHSSVGVKIADGKIIVRAGSVVTFLQSQMKVTRPRPGRRPTI